MDTDIHAIKFYESEDDYDYDKIIYIPLYNLYAYYDLNKFIVYRREYEFNINDYYNVENIILSKSLADNLKYIFDAENDIKIISKNNKCYFDEI
jgi:hypothetical protein